MNNVVKPDLTAITSSLCPRIAIVTACWGQKVTANTRMRNE